MIKFLLPIIVIIMHNNSFANGQISNLITPVSYFVNHVQQLNDLKNSISKYRKVSIVGTSGIGKTQLVRIYAYENKNKYNLIWFIDCNLDFNKEFVKLATHLNQATNANISEDAELAKKEVMDYLAHQDKWLLVFDNLKINENKKVQDVVDWEHNGNVIFCSQDSEILPHTIEMTTFNNEDAVTLASNLLESKDKNDIDFLVKAFSGYPILIVQGAQLLNKVKGLNKEEYKKKIYQSADKIKLNIELVIKELTPSATKLLSKIVLINNQSFSKQILNIITDNPNTIDDDIYQLSKFMLIVNINAKETNPIFEMHDIITQKVLARNGDKNNKQYLENIIVKLMDATPKNVIKGRIFRNLETIRENMEIILNNTQKYNINIYKVMELRFNILNSYLNIFDYYNAEKLVEWFITNDKKNNFRQLLMNNNEKRIYAGYLGLIGAYYKSRNSDYYLTLEYYTRAKQVFENIDGYNAYRYNILYNLSSTYTILGQLQNAKDNIVLIENMFKEGLVEESELFYIYVAKAKLFFTLGESTNGLEQIDGAINVLLNNGLQQGNLLFTNTYMLRADILNALSKYEEAYKQAQMLYDMHKPVKREDHEIFGRIYTQMAKSELGLGKIDKALEHVIQAIAIFLADERRNPKEADYSEDPDLAASYVVQGDIFFVQDNLKQAIASYKKAQVIYFYLYRDRSKNVAHVSYLYTQGAKVACKAKDLYNYKAFGKSQVKEFGVDHPNTVDMFQYCKQYGMDLWAKEN